MGFVSYDDLIAEITAGKRLVCPWSKSPSTAPVAGNWYSLWPVSGWPQAGAFSSTSYITHVRTNSSTLGNFCVGSSVNPDTKHLAYQWAMASAGAPPPTLMLVDMVGYYTMTIGAQQFTMDNTNGPDRYVSAGQSGLQAVFVCSTANGATATSISGMDYVDNNGNSAAMPLTTGVALTASVAAPSATLGARILTTLGGPFLPLQAGTTGIRSITDITFSANNTGAFAILMVRPLAIIPCPTAYVPAERDLVMQIAGLERVYDNACLAWLGFWPAATGCVLTGEVDVVWG